MRIFLVDDHEMVLHGLEAMLSRLPDRVTVVGTTTVHQEAPGLVAELRPDVVLCDIRLRGGSGIDLCAAMLAHDPAQRVVFLTAYDDEQYLFQAIRTGASGYLLKSIDGHELVRQLEAVMAGELVVDSTMAGRLAASVARTKTGEFWPGAHLGLTQRESEVLSLLVTGLSNRAIAGQLVVSDDTVKTHLRMVYRKLGVSDRSGAVAVALREGMFH